LIPGVKVAANPHAEREYRAARQLYTPRYTHSYFHRTGCSALRGVAAPRVMSIRLAAIGRNIQLQVGGVA